MSNNFVTLFRAILVKSLCEHISADGMVRIHVDSLAQSLATIAELTDWKDPYSVVTDPISPDMQTLREIRDVLIVGRDNALHSERFDPGVAVLLSHLIAACNSGCIVQAREYVPGGD